MSTEKTTSPDAGVHPGEVLQGKYRIDRFLGRGGMGVVMEAWHLELDERVAIKALLPELVSVPEAVARFQREGRALFKIKSQHVCRVFDVGTLDGGVPFMVMEYLEGDDLATLLAGRPQLEVERAVGLVVQACFGIGEVHARGVVHRDLKPENLILCEGPDGEPLLKLLDFGLSKERERPQERKRALTHQAQAMGTPHYMAPEQWLSAKDVGATADQWALGIILFEMLAGRRPFDGDQLALICSQTLNAPTPALRQLRPDLPAGLEAVLFKCLEKNPRRRYENVGALALALAPFAPPGTAAKAELLLEMLRQAVEVIEDTTALVQSPALLASSDMMVTEKRPVHGDPAPRGRSVTAQSWNSALGRAATRSRIAVGLAVLAVAAMVVVSVAILGRGSEGAPSSTLPAQAVRPSVTADDEVAGLPAADAPVASSAPPAATALASASSAVAAPKRSAAPPVTGARPPARPAEKHGDLFEERY